MQMAVHLDVLVVLREPYALACFRDLRLSILVAKLSPGPTLSRSHIRGGHGSASCLAAFVDRQQFLLVPHYRNQIQSIGSWREFVSYLFVVVVKRMRAP